MREILNRFAIAAVAMLALSSCINHDEGNDIVVGGGGTSVATSTTITPACSVCVNRWETKREERLAAKAAKKAAQEQ